MKIKIGILIVAALTPFAISLIPPLYVILVYYYAFTYPVSVAYGVLWVLLFSIMYARAETEDRRRLNWLVPLVIFAFIEPAHLILMAIGVPPFLPRNFTPS